MPEVHVHLVELPVVTATGPRETTAATGRLAAQPAAQLREREVDAACVAEGRTAGAEVEVHGAGHIRAQLRYIKAADVAGDIPALRGLPAREALYLRVAAVQRERAIVDGE